MISSAAAKAHIQKLLRYIEEVSATRPYSQTQKDLAEIYFMCDTIKTHISSTLVTCGSSELIQPVSTRDRSGRGDKRFEVAKFGEILEHLSGAALPFNESYRCAQLLSRWYHQRFLNEYQDAHFRYNITHIREWVHSIVLAYGHAIQHDSESAFVESMNRWCDSLSNENASKYPLPYEVYQFQKNLSEDKLTSVSLILWDTLLDAGMNHMSSDSCSFIYFGADDLLSKCKSICPRIAHWHTHYSKLDSEGIQVLKLHRHGGDMY